MSDNTKLTIFVIVILLMLYSKKLTEVVTAKVGGVAVTPNLGDRNFDYSVCGISADVARNGLAIKVCTNPDTGEVYPIEEYPNGGAQAQIVFLRSDTQAAENLKLNTPVSSAAIMGPVAPTIGEKVLDWYASL